MGTEHGGISGAHCWHSNYPPLAHSAHASAQALLAPPNYVLRGNSAAHTICLGYFLQPEVHLDAVRIHKIHSCPPGFRIDLENLPPDVCGYWNRHGQRASLPVGALGPLAGKAVPTTVCSSPDATPQTARGMEHTNPSGADEFSRLVASSVEQVRPGAVNTLPIHFSETGAGTADCDLGTVTNRLGDVWR